MTIYWSARSIPELDGLEPREQRQRFKEIYKQGRKELGVLPWVYLGVVAVVVAVAVLALGLTGVIMGAVIGGCIGFAVVILIQSPAIEHGRVWYRQHYGTGTE